MVRDTLVFILGGGRGSRLMPLTLFRSKPAVPFGADYRILDFSVSNCINSGLKRIYILTQYKSNSLDWHVRYAYSRHFVPDAGDFIGTVPPQQLIGEDWYRGTADAVYQNFQFVHAIDPKYTLVLAGDHVYKMNYAALLQYHADRDADITVAVIETPIAVARNQYGVLALDEHGTVVDFVEKPENPIPTPHSKDTCFGSMGIYAFKTEALMELLIEDARDPDSAHDFGRSILPNAFDELRVCGYDFVYPDGAPQYWRDVGTLDQYFEANMDLVRPLPELNLYERNWPIYTHQPCLPPAKFVLDDRWGHGRIGRAINSLVSSGCIISGATVEGSVVSPDVHVDEYSTVCNSIVMSGVRIGKHVHINRAIVDKDAVIPDGSVLESGNMRFNDDYHVTESGIVVVPKKMPVSRPRSLRRLSTETTSQTSEPLAPTANVLVIDDDGAIRLIIRELLEEHGYRVFAAEDGPTALRIAESSPLDLALVDINMDPMDGSEVIAELKKIKPTLKMVVVTATPDDARVEKAREMGVADCIYKPFDLRTILGMVRRLTASQAAGRPAMAS